MSFERVVYLRARNGSLRLLVTTAAITILVGACGRPGEKAEDPPRDEGVARDAKACGGYALIKDYLQLQVDAAATRISALVDPAVGEGRFDRYEKYDSVIAALVDCRELTLLEAVAGRLPIGPLGAIRRAHLFNAMRRWDRVEEFRPTLERLASRYPDELNLAPFRAGGMEYLLATLEDTHEDPNIRAYSAKVLAAHGTEEMIARMERLIGDGSVMQPPMGPIGRPSTVGEVVRHAIETIRRRFSDTGSK